jgi:hypothetical protein
LAARACEIQDKQQLAASFVENENLLPYLVKEVRMSIGGASECA